jgi:hypothetical protein
VKITATHDVTTRTHEVTWCLPNKGLSKEKGTNPTVAFFESFSSLGFYFMFQRILTALKYFRSEPSDTVLSCIRFTNFCVLSVLFASVVLYSLDPVYFEQGTSLPISLNVNFNVPLETVESALLHLPEFSYISHGTSHKHPKTAATTPSALLYFLISSGCHRQTGTSFYFIDV